MAGVLGGGRGGIIFLPNYWLQLQVRRVLDFSSSGMWEREKRGQQHWQIVEVTLTGCCCGAACASCLRTSHVVGACLTVLGIEQRPKTLAPSRVLHIPLEAVIPADSFP